MFCLFSCELLAGLKGDLDLLKQGDAARCYVVVCGGGDR